jgi:hypothetical protein
VRFLGTAEHVVANVIALEVVNACTVRQAPTEVGSATWCRHPPSIVNLLSAVRRWIIRNND